MRIEYVDGPRIGEVREIKGTPQIEAVTKPKGRGPAVTIEGSYYRSAALTPGVTRMRFRPGLSSAPDLVVPKEMNDSTLAELNEGLRTAGAREAIREGEKQKRRSPN